MTCSEGPNRNRAFLKKAKRETLYEELYLYDTELFIIWDYALHSCMANRKLASIFYWATPKSSSSAALKSLCWLTKTKSFKTHLKVEFEHIWYFVIIFPHSQITRFVNHTCIWSNFLQLNKKSHSVRAMWYFWHNLHTNCSHV